MIHTNWGQAQEPVFAEGEYADNPSCFSDQVTHLSLLAAGSHLELTVLHVNARDKKIKLDNKDCLMARGYLSGHEFVNPRKLSLWIEVFVSTLFSASSEVKPSTYPDCGLSFRSID